jgi:hypothetical protein
MHFSYISERAFCKKIFDKEFCRINAVADKTFLTFFHQQEFLG